MMIKNNQNKTLIIILLPLMALMAPFLVWIIEIYFPYPFIIEELTKLIFVLNLKSLPSIKNRLILGVIIGIMFSLSENIFYLMNFLIINNLLFLLKRFFLTTLLHLLTISLINIFYIINKKLIFLGLFLAVFIHYFYNYLIVK